MSMFLLALGLPANASQLEVSPQVMCELSARVVVATIESVQASWTPDHSTIERTVSARVHRTIKGAPAERITFTLKGGAVGDRFVHVGGEPHLLTNATYLLMLTSEGPEAVVLSEKGAVRITNRGALTGVTETEAVDSLGGCGA